VFLGIELANFYLNTPMTDPEYMRLRLDIIPEEIIEKYKLRDLVDKEGWVYIEIQKGMYGLPQAGIIANQLLEKQLSTKGYYQCQHTPGLWRHVWQSIVFCLVVDDFGIKVTNIENMHHLTSALEEHYKVAVDWKGSLFCGVKLTWDYINRHITTHMPGYIGEALTKYQLPKPTVPQHSPDNPLWSKDSEGGRRQLSPPNDRPNQARPKDRAHSPLLRASSRLHSTHRPQHDRSKTIQRH